jgi:hypothetical protein
LWEGDRRIREMLERIKERIEAVSGEKNNSGKLEGGASNNLSFQGQRH